MKKKRKTLSNKKQQFWFQILLHLFVVAKKEKGNFVSDFFALKKKKEKRKSEGRVGSNKAGHVEHKWHRHIILPLQRAESGRCLVYEVLDLELLPKSIDSTRCLEWGDSM